MSKNLKGSIMLALAAFIWGTAFVAQRQGMDHIGPVFFTCIRSFIGAIILLPIGLLFERKEENKKLDKKLLLRAGIICGVFLAVAATFQQIGLKYTAAGKAGFITALYIVMVPVFGFIFFKRKPPFTVWISVGVALIGMYLLCITNGFSLSTGDLWVLGCAFVFTLHILCIDIFSSKCNGVLLSCIQFFVAGIITLIAARIVEEPPTWEAIKGCLFPLIYTGVMSSGAAFTLQILGQKYVDPTLAVLLMSFESVFAVLGGWLILHETLTVKEIFGCVLMFIAVLMSQINFKDLFKKLKKS